MMHLTLISYSAAAESEEGLGSRAPPTIRLGNCMPHPVPRFGRFIIAHHKHKRIQHIVVDKKHYIKYIS